MQEIAEGILNLEQEGGFTSVKAVSRAVGFRRAFREGHGADHARQVLWLYGVGCFQFPD